VALAAFSVVTDMWDSSQVGYVIKPGRPDCI